MSWTSEFELPPQGPQVAPDDEASAEEGEAGEPVAVEPEPEPEPEGQGFELADIPEDGPLDPSVFDGLFTDLSEDEPDDYVQPDSFELVSDDDFIDGETDEEPDPPQQDGAQDEESDLGEDEDTIVEDFDELLEEDTDDDEVDAFDDQGPVDEDPIGEELDDELEDLQDLEPEHINSEHVDTEDVEPEDVDTEDVEPEELELEDLDPNDVELEDTDSEDPDIEYADLEYTEPEDPEDVGLAEIDLEELEFEDLDPVETAPEASAVDALSAEVGGLDGSEPGQNEGGDFKLFDPAAVVQDPPAAPPAQIIEEPLPAVATSPPIALDDPLTEQNVPPAEPYYEVPAAAVVDQLNPAALIAPRKRRWPAFVTAIVIGGSLGIGGAVLLTRMQNTGDDNSGTAQAPLVANEITDEQQTGTETTNAGNDGDAGGQATTTSLLADGQLVAHAIGFVPGTTELTEAGQATLQLVAASVAELPPEPTAITVRTFSQPTAEANRELSEQQAAAVGDYLASLGVEFGGLTLRGVGAAPLLPAMPVENFVVARASLRTTGLGDALAGIEPFEIGVDPDSLQLRPESVLALAQVGDALNANADGSVSLAGYSYDRPTDEANRAMAAAAVDAAREYLTTTHQIDPARLLVLAPGSLPYVLGPTQAGHVEIRRGRSVAVDVAVHSVEQPLVSFAAGSDALSGAAAEELSRVAGLLIEAQAQAVISVRTSGEPSADANSRLSELQANTIASYLADTGLAEGQVRVYGVGDIERLRSETAASEVTITILP